MFKPDKQTFYNNIEEQKILSKNNNFNLIGQLYFRIKISILKKLNCL